MSKILLGNLKGPKGNPGPKGDPGSTGPRGSRWVTGTAIDGISTTPTAYPTGIADSMVNDHYLNPKSGHIYRCQVAGDATTAQWVWVGNMIELMSNIIGVSVHTKAWRAVDNFKNDTAALCYGNGKFISVGTLGMFYSSDGITWNQGSASVQIGNMYYVMYDGDKFIACGTLGMLYSSDGIVWTKVLDAKAIESICYGKEKYIAITIKGYVYTSSDGYTWKKSSDRIGNDGNLYGICYGIGKFVAVGDHIYYSSDGITWTKALTPKHACNSVLYANGKFITGDIYGTIYYSSNGVHWDYILPSGSGLPSTTIFEIFYHRNKFITCCNKSIYHSLDGITWEKEDVTFDTTQKYIRYGAGRYVITGSQSAYYSIEEVRNINDIVEVLNDGVEVLNGYITELTANDKSINKELTDIKNSLDKHLYSSTEREVGIWTDGKPVYEKILTGFAAKTGNGEWQQITAVSGLNIDTIVDAILIGISGGVPCIIHCDIRLGSDGYLWVLNNNTSSAVTKITIRYTKTTDESEIIIEPET